jgi:Ricin-type beta-trefoil lectin domain-like
MFDGQLLLRPSRRTAKLFATLFVAGTLAFGAERAQAVANGDYVITNDCAGKVLALWSGNPNPGDVAVLRNAEFSTGVSWQISTADNGTTALRPSGSQSVLQTSYENTASGARIDLWSDWSSPSQRWIISDSGNGTVKFNFAAAPAMTLDAKDGGLGLEANSTSELRLFGKNNSCAQRWRLSPKEPLQTGGDKKLLQTGWDTAPPWFIKANIDTIKTRPFDGMMLRTSGKSEVFTRTAAPDDSFARDRANLETIEWGRFTDNFIVMMSGTPSGWDWFNDADWAASEANARQFARVAKAGRLKGVLFDPEPYLGNPWKYDQQSEAASHSFEQYQAKIRERGQRFMQVLQEEYPGLQVMAYYGTSIFNGKVEDRPSGDVLQSRLKADTFGMWASFLNGMLESAPSQTSITDGNEFAYNYLFANEYDNGAAKIRNELVVLVDPPLRNKYAAQVKVGQAIYADGVMNLWESPRFCGYYFDSDADRRKQLEHNVYHSLRAADRYAWFYNENMDWWGSKGAGIKIPAGLQEAIESARGKVATGAGLGFDIQAMSAAAKSKCDSRRILSGTISYPDGNAGVRFDVIINGKPEGRYACTPYSGDRSYDCVLPAGATATVTPLKEGYRFEPPSRSYSGQENNLWSEDFKAIKQ